MRRYPVLIIIFVASVMVLAACQSAPQTPTTEATACPEVEDCPECPDPVPCPTPVGGDIPFDEQWAGSAHAEQDAEAFRHWDEDDPAVVNAACAKCHSTAGYVDFHGADGTEFGSIENEIAAQENLGIQCIACHNEEVVAKDSVIMPSGAEITGLGGEARCMECHQGRQSTVSVNASIAEVAGVEEASEADPDAVFEDLGFANVHYFAAAASQLGTKAQGGFEYSGKNYDAKFAHVDEYDTCIECHNSHTLEVRVNECTQCHGEGEPATYRMQASLVDYDGDGDLEEGIAAEIDGLQEILYTALQSYAAETIGTPVVYSPTSYPYFFVDSNADGEVGEDEANYGNQYASWTPRLLRAAYNYQFSAKDPGGYAHGGKYHIQLLYDAIDDLDSSLVAGLQRDDPGHFAGSEEAFRHWDEDGEVPGSCSKCHSASGLPFFLDEGVTVSQPVSNGFQCDTCHGGGEFPSLYSVSSVNFPSGASVQVTDDDPSGLCMNCHQGRQSTVSVNAAIEGLAPDQPEENLGFKNVHYFAAGATRYGTEVQGGYEFDGKSYAGFFAHVDGFQSCTDCHDAHNLVVETDDCFTCHSGVDDVKDIRMSEADFDGDGDSEEGIYGEIDTLIADLYEAIQAYASENSQPLIYDAHSYPYFFVDSDGNGAVDPGEAIYPNNYGDADAWTPNLLKATYNYQYAQKDPGSFAHNGKYVIQLLIDSIEIVDGDVSAYTRPETDQPE